MPSAVEILFELPNLQSVNSAIGSVKSSLDALARSGQSASERQAKAADKGFRDMAKSAERSAKDATRAQEREAKEAVKIREAVNRLEVQDWQRKEREKTRSAESEERTRLSVAKKALAEQESAFAKSLRDRESRARAVGRTVGGAVGNAVGVAGRMAATAAALGGGFSVADSLGKGISREATAGIIFRGAAKKGDFTNQKQVQDLAETTAINTGGTTEDILGGLDQFVRKTGDLGAAKDMLEQMAKLSASTGTNFADMGNTAAEVYNQLGDAAKTMEVMRALAGQGTAGAIDIKDLGQYGGRLAASAAQFSGPLAGNIESFGAIAQLAKKLGGATDTAEATESVARLGSDMAKHSEGFAAIGVNVFADKNKTKFRNAEDVITESVVKSKGSQEVLRELFGERSIKAALGAQVAYSNAGGGKAGEAAIRQQFHELKSTTPTTDDVEAGAKARMAETQSLLNVAMEKLVQTINTQLMPVLPRFIEKFTAMIPAIESALRFFTSNSTWQNVGVLVSAAIGQSILSAGIGKGVEIAIVALMNRLRGGGGGGGGDKPTPVPSPGGGGTLAKLLSVAGAAITGYEVGSVVAEKAIDPMLSGDARGEAKAKLVAGNVESLTNAVGAGRISPEQAREQSDRVREMISQARVSGERSNAGGAVLNSITGIGAGVGQFREDRTFAKNSGQIDAALDKLAEVIIAKAGTVADNHAPAQRGAADPNHSSRGPLAP